MTNTPDAPIPHTPIDLVARLRGVPSRAFLRIPTGTPLISAELPIGEFCHEAAAQLEGLKRWADTMEQERDYWKSMADGVLAEQDHRTPDREGLQEDLQQLIRVCLTNPKDICGFIAANYPKEYAKTIESNKGKTLSSEISVVVADDYDDYVRWLTGQSEMAAEWAKKNAQWPDSFDSGHYQAQWQAFTDARIRFLSTFRRTTEPVSSTQQALFKHGSFTSHSGLTLPDKVDCDALTEADWDAVAAWFAARLTFGRVVGIPTGGIALARALEKHVTTGPTLLVDDVLTTGRSMEEARKEHPGAIGAVLFSRTRNVPDWITVRFVEHNQVDAEQPVALPVVDDSMLIGMLMAARPDVPQQVVAAFVKGKAKNLDYLTCDMAEFRRIATYLLAHVPKRESRSE